MTQQSIPRHMCKKDLFKNVYSIFIHNCETLETTQVSTNRTHKQMLCIHTMEFYTAIKKKNY